MWRKGRREEGREGGKEGEREGGKERLGEEKGVTNNTVRFLHVQDSITS